MSDMQFDAAQRAAAETTEKRVLVQSVAGSGKTRVIVGRIKWLIDHGVNPHDIVCITYTTAAAAVLTSRLGIKLGFCGTLHAFLLRLLNTHAPMVGMSPGVGVMDEERAAELLEQIQRDQRFKGSKESVLAAMRGRRGVIANPSPAQLVVSAFRCRLMQFNTVDYDSIIYFGKVIVEKLAKTGPWNFKCLLWDEMQDVSPEFAAVYNAMPVEQRFAAGDGFQSIFSFLGGSLKNMNDEAKVAKVIRLSTNYRCAKKICAAATKLQSAGGSDEQTLPRPDAPDGICEVNEYPDFNSEVTAIAVKIRSLNTEASAAVLVRTNALKDEYYNALSAFGLPMASLKDTGLPKDWTATRALIACLGSPSNDLLAQGFLSALRGKEKAEAAWREAVSKQMSLNDHALQLPEGLDAAGAVKFAAEKGCSEHSQQKLAAALALLEHAAVVGDLLVALQEPIHEKEDAAPGIIVSTIHSFKGCQSRTVFVPCAEEGVLPSARDAREPEALAEARRLFYVAITRAEQNLFISHCRSREQRFGRRDAVEMQASRFISEAGLAT